MSVSGGFLLQVLVPPLGLGLVLTQVLTLDRLPLISVYRLGVTRTATNPSYCQVATVSQAGGIGLMC